MQVVELVKKHIEPKVFWKSSVEEQEKVLRALFNDICQLYGIDGVSLVIDIDPVKCYRTGGGCYSPRERKIYLYKISLMTFLHEIAHMLLGPSERKARLWSHKVFYMAFPNLYLKNVRERKFFHVLSLEEIEMFNEQLK